MTICFTRRGGLQAHELAAIGGIPFLSFSLFPFFRIVDGDCRRVDCKDLFFS